MREVGVLRCKKAPRGVQKSNFTIFLTPADKGDDSRCSRWLESERELSAPGTRNQRSLSKVTISDNMAKMHRPMDAGGAQWKASGGDSVPDVVDALLRRLASSR